MKNLFDIPVLGPVLRSSWTWRLLRLALLMLLLLLIGAGWHQHAIPGVAARDPLMYTNLANHGFWVWWMMGVVLLALFLGRAWCAACPVGWINAVTARFGLRRVLPVALRSRLAVTVVLVALQLAVYLWAIHRYPDYTARLLALMLLLALTTGLVFGGRAFCTLFCPAGAVFSLYARFSPLRLGVSDEQICAGCQEQGCVNAGETVRRFALGRAVLFWRSEREACPEGLAVSQIGGAEQCTLCLGCVAHCPYNNVALGGARRFQSHRRTLGPSEVVFFMVLLGMLTANFSKVNVDLRDVLLWVPETAARLLGWQEAGFYLLATPWITLGLPLLLLLPGYLAVRLGQVQSSLIREVPSQPQLDEPSGEGRFLPVAGRLAYAFIPLLLAVHLVLALVKLNAKGTYLPLVLADPSGVKSYLAMNVMQTVSQPGVWLPLDVLKWLALAILLAGYLLSLAVARRSGRVGGRAQTVGCWLSLTLCAGLYLFTLARWLFIR